MAAIGLICCRRRISDQVAVHVHDVLFRDIAQGFLAWALATVVGIRPALLGKLATARAGILRV
jgi:hypothetical protein